MTGRWWIDQDEEFGGELLRWNDNVIAQTTGEEQDGCHEAYAALVEIVRAACLPLPAAPEEQPDA